MHGPISRIPPALVAGLALLWVLLVATSIPGGFTIDEASYLMSILQLRHGDFAIPGTEGLTPSPELLFFDPTARTRIEHLSHLGSNAPPLYAVLALPFSAFGFRGLIALNALAFVVSGLCVYWLAALRARDVRTPWIALATYLVGGYSIEYAQGVWPHALSAALATCGFCLAVWARGAAGIAPAALAGFVLGLAAGVRYPDVVFAFGVGIGLLLWARRRVASPLVFAAAFAVPMLACSFINHARLGSWNPISKGPDYLSVRAGRPAPAIGGEALRVLWAKVVDYSTHPVPDDPIVEINSWWRRSPRTGATVFIGALKKAWLQSSPWLVLSLLALGTTWARRDPEDRDVDLRAASLVVGVTLAAFALAGFGRHDGVCFNQRYFLELVPLCAVAAAWWLEGRSLSVRWAALGAAVGGSLGAIIASMNFPESPQQQLLGLRVPLAIAAALLVSALISTAVTRRASPALAVLFAMSVAYSGAIHLGEDLVASRLRRTTKVAFVRYVENVLPPGPGAIVVQKHSADMFAPLLLDHDLVIVDTWVDRGASTSRLVRELRARKRRVVLLPANMPPTLVEELFREFGSRLLDNDPSFPVFELDPPAGRPALPPRRP